MPFLERDNASLHYELMPLEAGGRDVDLPWITLINGHSRPGTDFRAMARHLAGRGLRVLALDNRGSGKTAFTGSFRLDDLRNDVAALWDHLGIHGTHLLGVSMGGMIAMSLALEMPDQVEGLILVSTAPSSTFLNQELRAPGGGSELDIHDSLLRYFSPEFASKNPIFVKSLVKETAKSFLDPLGAEGARAQREAMADFDLTSELPNIEAPTLILHGSEDAIIPLAAGRALAEGISTSHLEVFEGAGHLLLAETPRRLYERVAEFCGEANSRL